MPRMYAGILGKENEKRKNDLFDANYPNNNSNGTRCYLGSA